MRASLLLVAACSFDPRVADPGDATGDAPTGDSPPLGDPVRAIDVVDGQVTGGPHADFPLVFSSTATFLRDTSHGGDVARPDGFDLYFSGDPSGSARLAHEVERYDPVAGQLIAWIRIPSLTAATTIYLHYGSAAITTSQEEVPGVWSAGYVTVMHLDGGADATGHATAVQLATTETLDTPLDRGQRYDGQDDRIEVTSPVIDNIFATGGTAEGWFFATGYGENGFGRIWDKGHTNGWSFGLDANQRSLAFVHGDSIDFGEWNGPGDSVSLGAWHHGAVVYDKRSSANLPLLYVDGVEQPNLRVENSAGGTMDDDAGNQLMAGNRGAQDRTFQGQLDEVRMSNVARSSQWIATEFANQAAPSAFYTISDPL